MIHRVWLQRLGIRLNARLQDEIPMTLSDTILCTLLVPLAHWQDNNYAMLLGFSNFAVNQLDRFRR